MDRREFLGAASAAMAVGVGGVVGAAGAAGLGASPQGASDGAKGTGKPRPRASVCRWCFGGMKLEDLCVMAKRCGAESIELLSEKDWPVVQSHGLACAVANAPCSIQKGINRKEHHDAIIREGERLLPLVGAAGIPNLIIFSGNRGGMGDEEAWDNCAVALKQLLPAAEASNVTIIMELLNSKVDHKDYHCDRTPWGVELCKRVGSPRFKLLYDIYHMQVDEGDVIRTIRDNAQYIGHYHTAGVPGRNEIDESQELYYPAITRAILDTGYEGYIGQEFMPRRDPETSLRRAIELCQVS